MKILGIDTSTSVAAVALMDENKLIGEMTLNDKKTHSQKLMVLIDNLLTLSETKLSDLDAIAVAVGPGSFTGLRIGITTAKALAHPLNIKVIEVSSLEALANNMMTSYLVCPMMDARRNTVFTGLYSDEVLIADDQLEITDILSRISTFEQETIFLGDGAVKHQDLIKETLGENALIAPKHLSLSSASSLCEVALSKHSNSGVRYDDVHVNYLRKSQAEREYDERQVKK